MHRFALVILAIVLPLSAAAQEVTAQDADNTPEPLVVDPFVIVPGDSAVLDDYLWIARPLVVFADSPADPRFGEQMALLADGAEALLDRDIVVITDTNPRELSGVRKTLRPRGFMLVLIGKDGRIVFRKPNPWDVREISRAVDKQPLRKQELQAERALVVTD